MVYYWGSDPSWSILILSFTQWSANQGNGDVPASNDYIPPPKSNKLNGDTKVAEWLRNGAEEFQCMAQVNEEEGKHCESKNID